MSTAHSIMPPSVPRLTTTSLSASSASSPSPLAHDRRREQRAALLDVAASEHRVERGLHARQRNVGQKAQAPLVDADQRYVERRESARDRQHRAVAAEHDRQVHACRSSSAGAVGYPGTGAYAAVSASTTTSWPRAARNAASRVSGSAMPGLAWRPTSATRANGAGGGDAGMAAIKPQRARGGVLRPIRTSCVGALRRRAAGARGTAV